MQDGHDSMGPRLNTNKRECAERNTFIIEGLRRFYLCLFVFIRGEINLKTAAAQIDEFFGE